MILIRDNELATQEEINTRIEKMKSVLESISDREAADKVIQKIDAIGTVTLNSEKAIEEARKAYEGLDR